MKMKISEDIGYTIEPGVFKEFCDNAKSIVRRSNGSLLLIQELKYEIDYYGWKSESNKTGMF